jgi:hypothetical protein
VKSLDERFSKSTLERELMQRILTIILLLVAIPAHAEEFGIAENTLNDYRSVRYENIYTKVPTTGKLVSIKIDSGKTYYICREKSGYVIYNLEFRPMAGFKEKIHQELKESGRNWNRARPDDLLFTKELGDSELRRKISKYTEAVWVRNEIIVPEPQKQRTREE